MTWQNGGPGSQIPKRTRVFVKDRDKVCQLAYPGCTVAIEEIDHTVNVKVLRLPRSRANSPELLQGVCSACHKVKTQVEAQAGKRKHLRTLTNPGLANG